jgi:hypothetical protein
MPPRKSAKAPRAVSARDLRRVDQSPAALIGAEATPLKLPLSRSSTSRAGPLSRGSALAYAMILNKADAA